MPLKILVGLIVCNLFWSVHPIMGKWLLEEFSPAQSSWLRYSSAVAAYWLAYLWVRFVKDGRTQKVKGITRSFFLFPTRRKDIFLVCLLGFMAYCFSPLAQMAGLSHSLASENSIIIAMEPLLTAFLAWILLGERINILNFFAFCFAIIGFCFLAGVSPGQLNQDFHPELFGNALILISLLGEACFSILGKKLTHKYAPRAIFGTSLTVGVICLTLVAGFFYDLTSLFSAGHFSFKVWVAILWLGPIGTACGYLYAMYALSEVSVMSTVLLLFLQPVAGAVWGYLLLGDRLSWLQNMGGLLILIAAILPNAVFLRKRPVRIK
jgi:drug/metabolite transporter (DMT)-like permease